MTVHLDVVERKTKKVVHTVTTNETQVDRVQRGMSINMDHVRFKIVRRDKKVKKT